MPEKKAQTLMALLGDPIGHSFSPEMHNRSFARLGLGCLFIPLELRRGELLPKLLESMRALNFGGANVTRPYKVDTLHCMDELDAAAEQIGSVNTIQFNNGRLKGFNTDGIGFVRSLEGEKSFDVKGKNIFLCGAGGANRAIAVAMAHEGAGEVWITSLVGAEELVDELNDRVRNCFKLIGFNDRAHRDAVAQCHCFVNGSGLGMSGHLNETPVDKAWLKPGCIVADLTYNPAKTRLLAEAEQVGCPTLNGLGMFVYQGAEAETIWTGLKPDVDAMFADVREFSRREQI